jgi:hypothetical protein
MLTLRLGGPVCLVPPHNQKRLQFRCRFYRFDSFPVQGLGFRIPFARPWKRDVEPLPQPQRRPFESYSRVVLGADCQGFCRFDSFPVSCLDGDRARFRPTIQGPRFRPLCQGFLPLPCWVDSFPVSSLGFRV